MSVFCIFASFLLWLFYHEQNYKHSLLPFDLDLYRKVAYSTLHFLVTFSIRGQCLDDFMYQCLGALQFTVCLFAHFHLHPIPPSPIPGNLCRVGCCLSMACPGYWSVTREFFWGRVTVMALIPFRLIHPYLPRILHHSEEAYNIFTNLKPIEEGLILNFQGLLLDHSGKEFAMFCSCYWPFWVSPQQGSFCLESF